MFTFKLRRDTSTMWAAKNPLLADGEQGFESDTGKFKIGTGQTLWVNLPYFVPGGSSSVEAHIDDLMPHPVYDDGPSLTLLYENAKV